MRVIGKGMVTAMLALLATGCSSTTATRKQASLASSQVVQLVNQIVQSAVVALGNLQPVGGTVASGFVAPRAMRGPVTFQVSTAFSCEQGGEIQVSGTVAGNVDDATGTGTLTVDATETLASFHRTIEGTEMIVDGALQLTGNFVVLSGTPATSQSAALEGELAISAAPSGSGACSINLSFNFSTETAVATVTGTACGYTIVL